MKQLSQIIFFSVLGESAMQIVLAISTAVMFTQIFVHKIFTGRSRWIGRKKKRRLEDNMWLIE